MKPLAKKVAWLVLMAVIIALRPPLSAWSQNQPAGAPVHVQTTQSLKWRFGGNEAGTGTYIVSPDGTFESVTSSTSWVSP